MRPHLPEEEIHAFCDGELSPEQRAEIAEHLLGCLICRAAHAEVDAVRARSTELLSYAVPRRGHRTLPMPEIGAPAHRAWAARRRMPLMVAGIAMLLGTASLLRLPRPAILGGGGTVSEAFSIPSIFAPAKTPAVTTAPISSGFDRSLAITAGAPGLSAMTGTKRALPAVNPGRAVLVDPIEEVDPAPGWEGVTLKTAMAESQGAMPQLEGVPLKSIRMLPSALGARPSFLARYTLPDGRSVWVAEGAEEEMNSVQGLLEQHGLTLSASRRTRPDYLVTPDGTRRTVRMVIVAANLPSDSVDAIAARVKTK